MFKWNDKYRLGDETLDREHEEFVKYYNLYKSKMEKVANSKERRLFVESMMTYIENNFDEHIKHEESYMNKIGYKRLTAHVEQHEELRDSYITKFHRMLKGWDENEERVIGFVEECTGLLLNHMVTVDSEIKNYAEYVERCDRYSASNIALEDRVNILFEKILDKNIHAKIISDNYEGTSFGRAFYEELIYEYKENRLACIFGFEQSLMVEVGAKIYGENQRLEIAFVLSTIQIFREHFMEAIAAKLSDFRLAMRLEDTKFLTLDMMQEELKKIKLKTSVMFDSDYGKFVIASNGVINTNKRI